MRRKRSGLIRTSILTTEPKKQSRRSTVIWIVLSVVAVGGLLAWRAPEGPVPTARELQQAFGLSALPEKASTLHGRSVRVIPFTFDASDEAAESDPPVKLYLDEGGNAIAVGFEAVDYPTTRDPGISDALHLMRARNRPGDRNATARGRFLTLLRVSHKFLDDCIPPWDILMDRLADNKLDDARYDKKKRYGPDGIEHHLHFAYHGYDIDIDVVEWFRERQQDGRVSRRTGSWLVRGGAW